MTNQSGIRAVVRDRLRARTEHRGLSGAELGRRVGASQPVVSRWLSGSRLPELAALVSLSDELGVSLDWICGRSEDAARQSKD